MSNMKGNIYNKFDLVFKRGLTLYDLVWPDSWAICLFSMSSNFCTFISRRESDYFWKKFSDLKFLKKKMKLRDKIKYSETPSKIVQQVGKKSSLVGSAGASSGAHTAHHLDAVPMSTPCINVPKRNDITKNFG